MFAVYMFFFPDDDDVVVSLVVLVNQKWGRISSSSHQGFISKKNPRTTTFDRVIRGISFLFSHPLNERKKELTLLSSHLSSSLVISFYEESGNSSSYTICCVCILSVCVFRLLVLQHHFMQCTIFESSCFFPFCLKVSNMLTSCPRYTNSLKGICDFCVLSSNLELFVLGSFREEFECKSDSAAGDLKRPSFCLSLFSSFSLNRGCLVGFVLLLIPRKWVLESETSLFPWILLLCLNDCMFSTRTRLTLFHGNEVLMTTQSF